MQRALEAKDAEAAAGTAGTRKNAPLAIVAVPGLELAAQVRKALIREAYSLLGIDFTQVKIHTLKTKPQII